MLTEVQMGSQLQLCASYIPLHGKPAFENQSLYNPTIHDVVLKETTDNMIGKHN